ncbi:hypothetical protein CLOM_g22669 [Closterium sp. NIES-68]|nr:hypothetical protein CLOM_g22669 [Closterium sp. NIES-68]GJP66500.1 hypothetical protein CLOP_g23427 [Closterium sp. NIES-67]
MGEEGPRRITHVVFDMDGLILDTEGLYTVAQQRILSRFNREFTWALKVKMMGKKAAEAAQVVLDELDLHGEISAEEFLRERESLLREEFPNCQLLPGAERLIRHLHAHKIPMAIGTGSHKIHFGLKTSNHGGLFALIHHCVLGDDPEVPNGKPAPDVFRVAAARFDPPPSPDNVLVFEDAPLGVDAARNAGMWVVMVPDSNVDASLCTNASLVLPSLLDFDPVPWGLPPFSAESGSS